MTWVYGSKSSGRLLPRRHHWARPSATSTGNGKRLLLFLDDGNIELTNNRVERELRKLVLGRRNWLFAWEDLGGERTDPSSSPSSAPCVAHGINPRAYLHLVINLIMNRWPQAKLRDLLPDRLAVTHPELLVRDGPIRSTLLGIDSSPRLLD